MQGSRGRGFRFRAWLTGRLAGFQWLKSRNLSARKQRGDSFALAVLRHELLNPLNGLLGMTQLLRRSELSGEQSRLLGVVEESARQVVSVVERLHGANLPTHKHLATEFSPDTGPIDAIELLEQVIWAHTLEATSRGLQLLLVVEENIPRFWRTDASLLRQVLDNLLTNAIKFTASGHVCLEVRLRAVTAGDKRSLELLVRDTGIGIHPAHGSDLFEAGHGVLRENAGKYTGSGLGLWVCQDIMHALSGRIDYHSRPGAGSCFRLRLPRRVVPNGKAPGGFQSRLLDSLKCRVQAEHPLEASVCAVLIRLGVPIAKARTETAGPAGPTVIVEINGLDKQLPGLHLSAYAACSRRRLTRLLAPPVLECTLGPLLLELALELNGMQD